EWSPAAVRLACRAALDRPPRAFTREHPMQTTNLDPPVVATGDATVADLVRAVDAVTGGRLLHDLSERNPWTISKTSGIPGKDVLELPGLLVGDPAAPVRHVALAMTLTE